MKLNTATDYGIRIILCLAKAEKPLSSSKLAGILGISPRYLLQIGAKLQKAGLVEVALGAAGGYSLGKDFYKLTPFTMFLWQWKGLSSGLASQEKQRNHFPN